MLLWNIIDIKRGNWSYLEVARKYIYLFDGEEKKLVAVPREGGKRKEFKIKMDDKQDVENITQLEGEKIAVIVPNEKLLQINTRKR